MSLDRTCSIARCGREADVLVRFAHGTGWWAYCQYHDARSGPRRFRGWQPWQIAEVIEEELIVYWPEFDEPGRPR